jgi:hypothetical protein
MTGRLRIMNFEGGNVEPIGRGMSEDTARLSRSSCHNSSSSSRGHRRASRIVMSSVVGDTVHTLTCLSPRKGLWSQLFMGPRLILYVAVKGSIFNYPDDTLLTAATSPVRSDGIYCSLLLRPHETEGRFWSAMTTAICGSVVVEGG